ncbi:thiopurine S-methyltransferase [Kangiella koreensis]|uniref:Thiopurine S-methyltransferase n=1 Tax=Kangiella koreensis (strain DSM 16069 / JCM 12317 / KCTC 12182 / SW-125) TaxID=523791 RepID=C7RA80_KANKD|nr:thiopurine S-methyltransferase [Kangiella koreensis]ACV26199.1 Thiopurine S-methyltransferase [Kangiella koreensis DSM 16069]
MDFEFWDNCWQRESQPFHLAEAHTFLVKYVNKLFNKSEKVLVPLSGKSLDLLFLAEQGYYPVGVEFNPKAVNRFIQENQLEFSSQTFPVANGNELIRYHNDTMEVWLADFFEVTENHIGTFEQVYDRAAFIALPDQMRTSYAKHLKSLLADNATILLVTMDYLPDEMSGPPFHITLDEIKQQFPDGEVEELCRCSLLDSHPRWKELNLSRLDEVLYQITF